MKYLIKRGLIEVFMKTHNLDESQFCKLCGITLKQWQRMLDGDLTLNISVFFKVADVLKVSTDDLFEYFVK